MDIDTLYGRISAPEWRDDLIIRSLQVMGEWGAAETELLAPLVSSGDVFWDIGAFLGTFTIGLCRLVPLARIVAVEANPEIFPFLETNLRVNLRCGVVVEHAAISEHEGWLSPKNASLPGNNGAQSYAPSTADAPASIPGTSLKALRAQRGDYDVLKLDIEGMETSALRSDADYLRSRQPVVWAECNEDESSFDILDLMRSLGYETAYVAFPAFRTDNFKGSPELIHPMAYEAALVAAPPERLSKLPASIVGEDLIHRRVSSALDLRRAMYDTPRWSMAEWAAMSRAELIARLGHQFRGEPFSDFLNAQERCAPG